MKTRKISAQERATWGKCPICGAADGKPCKPTAATGTMERMMDGTHLGRLHSTPAVVDVTPDAPTPKPASKPRTKAKPKKASA